MELRNITPDTQCDNAFVFCENPATWAVIPDDDPDMVEYACDAHHVAGQDGTHVHLQTAN
jgi:hypothetical protein